MVVIEGTIYVCVGRETGVGFGVGWTKKVQCGECIWDKFITHVHQKTWVDAVEGGNEVFKVWIALCVALLWQTWGE